jgi:hypothetical protein
MSATTAIGWAVLFDEHSPIDGHRRYLAGGAGIKRPASFAGYVTIVFRTRKETRAFIRERWGYIAKRPDLRKPPHCWRMPKPVRVTVAVKEAP